MKVSIILVIYNARKFIKPVFDAILAQTHKDLEVIAVINGNDDGSKELIAQNYPQVKIIDPGINLLFARGNNLAIEQSEGEFIQLVNQDLILEPDYIEKMLRAFDDKRVAAATGKLLRYNFDKNEKLKIIDSTGITMSKSGRGRDRGQNQIDQGQFDKFQNSNDKSQTVFAVSGAGSMYRRLALQEVRYCENYKCEYFDEDFGAYWEDMDLSWRLNHCGYKNVFVPDAVAYHGRTAGQAAGGYMHLLKFIRHHSKLSREILKLNYKNHIFTYIKNQKWPSINFILREIAMLGYILVFEPSTLKVIPEMFRLWPRMMRKRRFILD
jgi:GT2 family glycosyltransferase